MPITKIDKKKDGLQGYRVRVNYTAIDGSYKQLERTAYGKAEAQSLEQKLLRELSTASDPKGTSLTVQELAEEYHRRKTQDVRQTSLDKSISRIKNHILPIVGSIRLKNLTVPTLAAWKEEIGNKDLVVVTKQGIYSAFHALLQYAVKLDYLPRNPLDKVGNFTEVLFEKPADKLNYYTSDEFKQYISVAISNAKTQVDYGCYVFFCIAFYTGMRKGEINALKWSDISGNIIHVRRSVAQKVKGHSIIETPPKNESSYRDLKMPLPLLQVLDEHKARQKRFSHLWSEDYRVCGGASCLGDTSISNHNRFYSNTATLKRIRIHDFRHSHASVLVNAGINIQEIARRLGHSDVKVTWNIYSHLYPKEEERAVDILNQITI